MNKLQNISSRSVMSLVAALVTTSATGCKSAGMGAAVRTDVTAQMQSAQPAITSCYASALTTNRKLRGMIMLSFTAEPDSGKFINTVIVRDELNDPRMKQCVMTEISKLKLSKPQSTKVLVSYPLRFAPNN
jgi:hypothetical protein